MRVHVDQIGPEGFDIDEAMTDHWLSSVLGKGSPFRPQGDGRFTSHLDLLDQDVVHVQGRVFTSVEANCSRCLEPVVFNVDSALDVTLFPSGREPEPEASGEVADEDMGVATYEAPEVDLTQIVRDEVFLGLPMIPLCSEDCEGLCVNCGENLNRKKCSCRPAVDSRWQSLLNLKPS